MIIALVSAASSVHTRRWANAFTERGHTVHLLSQHAPLPGYHAAVQVHRFPHRKGLGYLLNGAAMRRCLQGIAPDVVNVHYASGYGSLVPALGAWPVVLNVWGSDVYAFPDTSFLHRRWLLRNLRAAGRLVSTSTAMAERTRALLGGNPAVTVVPFGIDPLLFAPATQAPAGPPVVLTVKTLAPTYGIDRLLDAFALLCAMPGMDTVELRIAGTGPDRGALEARAKRLSIAPRVRFLGQVAHDAVPDLLRGATLFAALSRAESFGVAVLEASACGLPVVVSDAGGLPEVVQHERTGYVVPAGDPRLAAESMHALLIAPSARAAMGAAGRQWVLDRFAWDRCVDAELDVLQQASAL